MELQYIEVKNWDKLKEDDIIIFKLPEKQMKYYVSIGGTFCVNSNNSNDEIFRYLNLNTKSFVENIVGYKCPCGVWPIIKSIDDLKKVIKALDDECIKKFGMSNTPSNSIKELEAISSSTTSINMDKPETQFEAELNLFPTKKHYQLNFNY